MGTPMIKLSDIVNATFCPKRTDDLKPGVEEWIGKCTRWQALWMIDEGGEGSYIGQWAMGPVDQNNMPDKEFPYIWVPLCDLEVYND